MGTGLGKGRKPCNILISIYPMKQLFKKVLTDKNMRNAALMSAFVVTAANVGTPWNS